MSSIKPMPSHFALDLEPAPTLYVAVLLPLRRAPAPAAVPAIP
jgi:hypothetical protein